MKPSGARINYHFLESNRVCAANPHESNFHIFYILLLGSENVKNICLDPQTFYNVSLHDFSYKRLLTQEKLDKSFKCFKLFL